MKDYVTEKAYAMLGNRLVPDEWCFDNQENLLHFIKHATGSKPAAKDEK